MKELAVRVYLFDPVDGREFSVSDGIDVDIVNVRVSPWNISPTYSGSVPLVYKENGNFYLDARDHVFTHHHYLRVGFSKPNFSKSLGKLLSLQEVTSEALPLYHPSRLPYWDSRRDDSYRINRHFATRRFRHSSENHHFNLKIPIRRIFNIGHRGAPYEEPENTIHSFTKALRSGANGLEVDLCRTKDNIAVFHDPKPLCLFSPLDRTNLENLPYPIVSPRFETEGNRRVAIITNGNQETKMNISTGNELDLVNLTLDEVRQCYHYRAAHGEDHAIPDLDGFLLFAQDARKRRGINLEIIYLDVKTPDSKKEEQEERIIEYGRLIGKALNNHQPLPRIIVGNPDKKSLSYLKAGIEEEQRHEQCCDFAYDAQGNVNAWLESIPLDLLQGYVAGFVGGKIGAIVSWILCKLSTLLGRDYDPVKVTRAMRNAAVSVGSFARPKSFEEIKRLINDRDRMGSNLKTIIYYTLNDPQSISQSIGIGVNGIVSDRPDEVKKWLMDMGILISCAGEPALLLEGEKTDATS